MYKYSWHLYIKGVLTVVPLHKSDHKYFDRSACSLSEKETRSQIIKLARLM